MRPVEALLKRIPELDVTMINSSCCGMAGHFGYQKETLSESIAMAELDLAPAIRNARKHAYHRRRDELQAPDSRHDVPKGRARRYNPSRAFGGVNKLSSNVIVRAPLHVQVAERLRVLIDSGELAPGARPNEVELCNDMGVSRTPLREAIRSLATEGLVELQPNRGAIVSVISREDVTEILPIMASLEGLGGRLAAVNMEREKILQVRNIHNQMIDHYRNGAVDDYFETNRLIHELITEGSGNQTLVDTINSLSAKVRRARFSAHMTEESWAKAVAEHEEMIDALESRDSHRLEAVLIQHIETKRTTIIGALKNAG